jgi:prepilin-type N-terminal cleavage/methylation domain-containing protein
MAPMARLAERMKIQTSAIKNKGFTLVELLVVLLIIGVIASIATLSINTARPSQVQLLFSQLKNQVLSSKKTAQLKNIKLRLIITDNQSTVEHHNPQNGQWVSHNNTVPKSKLKGAIITSEKSKILFFPNGYVTSSVISLSQAGVTYQFNPSSL